MNRILNAGSLVEHGNIPGRQALVQILEAGLQAADPYYNTLKLMRLENGRLMIGTPDFEPSGMPVKGPEIIDLDQLRAAICDDTVIVSPAVKAAARFSISAIRNSKLRC